MCSTNKPGHADNGIHGGSDLVVCAGEEAVHLPPGSLRPAQGLTQGLAAGILLLHLVRYIRTSQHDRRMVGIQPGAGDPLAGQLPILLQKPEIHCIAFLLLEPPHQFCIRIFM